MENTKLPPYNREELIAYQIRWAVPRPPEANQQTAAAIQLAPPGGMNDG